MPYEEFESHLKDEDLYDEDLHSYFTSVFINTDQEAKELKVVRGLTNQIWLLALHELLELKVTKSVTVTDKTLC